MAASIHLLLMLRGHLFQRRGFLGLGTIRVAESRNFLARPNMANRAKSFTHRRGAPPLTACGLDKQTMIAIADFLQTLALAACLLLIAWIMSGMADAPLIAG